MPIRFVGVVCIASVGIAVVAGVPPDQQGTAGQAPTFRERADVVQLDVSVLDRQGQPARGLTRGDFTILEDGVPQRWWRLLR